MPRTRQRKHAQAQFEKVIAQPASRQGRPTTSRTNAHVHAEPNKPSVRGAPASRTASRRLNLDWMEGWIFT